MTDFSGNTYVKPEAALQLATVLRSGAGQLAPIKEQVLDWISRNVFELSKTDRALSHFQDENHGLEIINYRNNGDLFFAVRFSRPGFGTEDLERRANTEIIIRDSHGDLAIGVKKSYQRKRKVTPKETLTFPPTILKDIQSVLPLHFDGRVLAVKPERMGSPEAVVKVARMIHGVDPAARDKKMPRQLPIIIAVEPNPVTDEWNQSLLRITDRAYGFAHVYVVPPMLLEGFNNNFGRTTAKDWRLKPGDIRNYGIDFSNIHSSLDEHPRLFSHTVEAEKDFVHGVLKASLSNRFMSNDNLPSFDELQEIILNKDLSEAPDSDVDAQVRLLRQKVGVLESDLRAAEQLVEEVQANNDKLQEENRGLKRSVAERDRAINDLTNELAEAQAALAATKPKSVEWKLAAYVSTEPFPDQISNVTEWAKKHFPDSLEISNAFQTECERIGNLGTYEKTEKFYQILTIMGMYYSKDARWDEAKKQEGWMTRAGNLKSLGSIFIDRYGIDASKNTMTSMGTNKSDYKASDASGDVRVLDWHVGQGNSYDSSQIVRVYYAQPKEPGKPVFIGKGPSHLGIGSQ